MLQHRVARRGLHHLVVESLGARVAGGGLVPGEALPNEAELSASLGVSRTVVREAVKVLAEKGLVRVRPKSGTRVVAREHWRHSDADVLRWQFAGKPSMELYLHVSEVRQMLEPAAAALAADRRTDAEAELLAELAARLAVTVDDREAYIATDIQLHSTILEATRNELVAALGQTIEVALCASRQLTIEVEGGSRRALAAHEAVVEAIVRHQSERARVAMARLLRAARGDIETAFSSRASLTSSPGGGSRAEGRGS